jgi:outer membrane immunogenic protein
MRASRRMTWHAGNTAMETAVASPERTAPKQQRTGSVVLGFALEGRAMKTILLSTVASFVIVTAAGAADLQRPAYKAPFAAPLAETWAGPYIGIIGGAVRHDASLKNSDCLLFIDCGTNDLHDTGGTFGGVAGWNWQQGSFVYGLEGDWSWVGAKASDSHSQPNSPFSDTTIQSADVTWLATVRGRVGLAFDATLVYVTGGVAFGHVKNSFTVLNGPAFGSPVASAFTEDKTKVGWTAGVGLQHMFAPHWVGRAEIRYVDLGSSNVSCTSATFNCTGYHGKFSNSLVMGLVGLDYKF